MSKRLSVCIISSSVGKTPEDVPFSFVFDEAYRLAQRGVEIHVVRSKIEKDSISYGIYYHGIGRKYDFRVLKFLAKNITCYPPISLVRKPTALYWENLYASNVVKVVEKNDLNLIHAHFAYPEGLVGLLAKRRTGKPLVVTIHGYDILTEPDVNFGLRLSKKYDILIKYVIGKADAIIVNSRAVYSEALKCGASKEKLHLIPLGVDLERFNPSINSSELKKKLQIENKHIVFTLKAHEPRYRIEDVIRAASFVLKQRKDVVFLIGGQGSLKPYHENLACTLGISNNIIFLGKISPKELPLFYSVCDIFVNPALGEGFGIVTAEAMAAGKPVIAVKRYGSMDLVSDHVNGFLVNPMDPKQIAKKILWLIEHPDEAKRMGMNGRRIVEEKFDVEKRIDRIIEVYERIISKSN
jgi:glycosyltransferase involved in cell wall biosynthesis